MIGVGKSLRLLHVDLEIASTVEEGVFAVDLRDAEIVGSADGKECAYRVNSDNGSKRLVEVQFSLLCKSFDNNAGFVLLKSICCIAFCSTDPSQWQGTPSRW